MREITVFSGSAHPELAAEICQHLGVPVSPTTVHHFGNGCMQVQLNANCRQNDVFIVQPLVPPVHDHLMELLLMLDAARGASAARVTAVVPYFAYARSDKKDAPRISIGARLVADLFATAGANRVLTLALHAPQVHGFFSVPVDHLNALGILAEHFQQRDLTNTVVVSPDLGNAKPATQFARLLGLPVAAGNKQRINDQTVIIDAIVGDVTGREIIVLDDEIANGGTIIELLRRLRERGAGRVSIACTHGLFTGSAIDRLRQEPDVREIVRTNSVPFPSDSYLDTMYTCSIAPLFAEAIRRTHIGESISSLFSSESRTTSSPAPV